MAEASCKPKEVVVVVGNGMVGHRFLDRLKRYDTAQRFSIVTIGEEPLEHYNRMQLTEYFEHLSIDKLKLAAPGWYADNDIELRVQSRVMAIDTARKVVTCQHVGDDQQAQVEVSYDHLVLATGASALVPRLPGVSLRGVFVYRTIQDLNDIIAYSEAQYAREQAGGRKQYALVVGGGLLGLEAAKAVHDLHIGVRIVNRGGRLMSRQLDDAGAKVLHRQIETKFGIEVLYHKSTQKLLPGTGEADADVLSGVEFMDGQIYDDVFMIIFATGIKPRDELAQAAGMKLAERGGGIIVDDYLATSADGVYAVGECISHRCVTYGLVAPGNEMADTLAKNLATGGRTTFLGGDVSTKLKLMGMEVGSFGAYFPEDIKEPYEELVYNNPLEQVYKKLFFSTDGKKLLGGILVGDTSDFPRLTLLFKTKDSKPLQEPPNEILLGKRGGETAGNSVLDLPDEAQVCSCNNVTKGDLCSTIRSKKLTKLADVKKICNAGTCCGGCIPMVKDILDAELAAAGTAIDKSLCEHFAYSRQELYQIIMVEKYATFTQLLAGHGRLKDDPRQHGCEICKPTVASILASLQNGHILQGDRAALQDSNDRFLANLQKSGQFSVVPRIAGGEITPDKLIVLGQVAKQYGLYTKITGGQRVDLFGAQKQDLPAIWKALVDVGFESGHAYGKALRTVKSCVGSTWCRYGQQDSVGFAIFLENRYKGVRSPHKIKGGVSGCTRECAEARGKDFGCIATEKGYNVYVCGNGGTNPKHAVLLASDVPQELTVKYLDRFLMYYIMTADRLQRTSKWLDSLEGGIEQLKRVVMQDSLGICATLEEQMGFLVGTYECEWKKVIESPELQAQFAQFKNTSATQQETVMVEEREQLFPRAPVARVTKPKSPTGSAPVSPKSPSGLLAAEASALDWVSFGSARNFLPNSGGAVLYGGTQLAVFNVVEICNGIEKTSWYATQNMCPHDHAFVLAQGIVGDFNGRPKVACPMDKRSFDLADGTCLTEDDLWVEAFPAREQDGEVFVLLPSIEELDERLATAHFLAGSACEVKPQSVPALAAPAPKSAPKEQPVTLDW